MNKRENQMGMEKLIKYLEDNCIQKAGFCKKIGTTTSNFSSIIRGKSIPGLKIAYEIEKHTKGEIRMMDLIPDEWKKK